MLSTDQRRQLHELRLRRKGRLLTADEVKASDAYIAYLEQQHALTDNDENVLMDELIVNFPSDDERHYVPEVTTLNEGAANIRWGGESKEQRNAYVENRKRDNGVDCFDIAVDGPEVLVFKQENGSGKLVRLWLNKDENVSARVRYDRKQVAWRLEVYVNRRVSGRWSGNRVAEHYVHRTVTDEAELTVAKWVSIWFARLSG